MKDRRIINPFAICNYPGPTRKTTEHLPPPIARAIPNSEPITRSSEPVMPSSLADVVTTRFGRLLFSKRPVSFDIEKVYPLKFALLTYDSCGVLPYLGGAGVFIPWNLAVKFSFGTLTLDPSTALLKVETEVYGKAGVAKVSRTTDFMLWPGVFNELNFARFYLVCNASSPLVSSTSLNFDLDTDPDPHRKEAYRRFKDSFFDSPTSGFSN